MALSTELIVVDDYVAFDTETTGRYIHVDEITEIGAVKVKDGVVADRFSLLVNPGRPIPQEVIELTGITDEMVAGAPAPAEGVLQFLHFAEGLPLVGHNVTFDVYMILNHVSEIPNILVDTMRIGRRVAKDLPDHKLGTLFAYSQTLGYGAQIEGNAHRAGYDAEMARVIYEALKPELELFLEDERNRGGEYSGFSAARLSEATVKKSNILAQVRNLADNGISSFEELALLYDTIASDSDLSHDTVFANLLAIMSQAMADDVISADEQSDILIECRKLADPVVRDTQFRIDIDGRRFVLTGSFEHGSDAEIIEAVAAAGGEAHKKSPTVKDDYVVVGNLGSKRWAFGDYGTKVDKAISMQAKGKSIIVISESVLFACLS